MLDGNRDGDGDTGLLCAQSREAHEHNKEARMKARECKEAHEHKKTRRKARTNGVSSHREN